MRIPASVHPVVCCLLALAGLLTACQPRVGPSKSPLRLVRNASDDACGYVSAAGDTVIPFGRYPVCQTEQFTNYALVVKPGVGWVGIDQQERVLFRVFNFDNGPDYPAEGLFRIVNEAGLIGFADSASGRILLPPQYEAAFPFEQGRTQVGSTCQRQPDGEHWRWKCAEWHYINLQGKTVSAPPE